jgi:hypothetical protein
LSPPAGASQPSIPAVPESLDDIRAQMRRLIKVEDGKHLVTAREEFDKWRLKALIKLDAIRRREGIAGFEQEPVQKTPSQQAVVDPTTNQIAWRAFTCWNPECLGKGKGGGPVAFAMKWEHASIGPGGKVVWRTLSEKELPPAITCPVCGLADFIQYYDEPEAELRREQLTAELARSRQIRAEAETAGRLVPAGVRTPTEIMRELNELPKLFLLPQS